MQAEARNSRILVVDDDDVAVMVLCQALEDMGYETLVADTAERAWQLLNANPDIGIACIDWMLPGMSGPALCGRIKHGIRDRYIYTIIVTSKTAKEDLIAGIEAGADEFLSKPVHLGELLCRVHAGERMLRYDRSLRAESEKSERLLHAILPRSIAERMKRGEMRISDHIEECSVMFVDVCGFTEWCMQVGARELVEELERLFSLYDDRIRAYGVEKIKSIGDAYLIAAGIPEPEPRHAEHLAETALALNRAVEDLTREAPRRFTIRTGIASGPAVAGVIGNERFIYDVWGPTVNLASRLEALAPPGQILVNDALRDRIAGKFDVSEFGVVEPKGFASQPAWTLS